MATGPGYNDAEGIYQYGEDDAETLFSDLLNRGQQSVSQQLAVDRQRLDDLEEEDVTAIALPTGYSGSLRLITEGGKHALVGTISKTSSGNWTNLTIATLTQDIPPYGAAGSIWMSDGTPAAARITTAGAVAIYPAAGKANSITMLLTVVW